MLKDEQPLDLKRGVSHSNYSKACDLLANVHKCSYHATEVFDRRKLHGNSSTHHIPQATIGQL